MDDAQHRIAAVGRAEIVVVDRHGHVADAFAGSHASIVHLSMSSIVAGTCVTPVIGSHASVVQALLSSVVPAVCVGPGRRVARVRRTFVLVVDVDGHVDERGGGIAHVDGALVGVVRPSSPHEPHLSGVNVSVGALVAVVALVRGGAPGVCRRPRRCRPGVAPLPPLPGPLPPSLPVPVLSVPPEPRRSHPPPPPVRRPKPR